MSDHSRISPSSAHIWGKPGGCTGYVKMSELYPELEESEESREGTASHEVGERLIKCEIVNPTAENGVVISEEIFDGAEMYADNVLEVLEKYKDDKNLKYGIEARIEAKDIHEESYGTSDAWVFVPSVMRLYIWDYKFGHGVVEAFENWQLINYASGILNSLGVNGKYDGGITVYMRIVQPRAHHRDGPIRDWKILAVDLRPYFNVLANNATIALGPDATTLTGSHCKDCEARHACAPALKAGVALYEVAGGTTPVELSVEATGVQLAIIKRAKKQLEYLESGYEEQIKSKLRSGVNVPGWAVETSSGRLDWSKPVPEVLALGDMMGINLRKPEAPITPVQAKKEGLDESLIKAYSARSTSGLKLVQDNNSKARQVFK